MNAENMETFLHKLIEYIDARLERLESAYDGIPHNRLYILDLIEELHLLVRAIDK